jgi:hypothetical protein
MPLAMSGKALRRSAGKALSVDIYERGDHRYHVVWRGRDRQEVLRPARIPSGSQYALLSRRLALAFRVIEIDREKSKCQH